MHFIFPHNFVYWTKVKNHQEIKEKYLKKILNTSQNWEKNPEFFADFTSSFRDHENTTLNQEIKTDKIFLDGVIWNPIDDMFKENFFIGHIPEASEIAELWFNVYTPGQSQEVHDHSGHYVMTDNKHVCSSYSGIYLLECLEKNKTVFYQPGPNPGAPVTGAVNYKTEHIEEGNVIIFPSTLLHYVLPCEKNRVTIAFNLFSIYENIDKIKTRLVPGGRPPFHGTVV